MARCASRRGSRSSAKIISVKAFKFAHEADPSAELYYNDYDLELPAKRAGGVALIKKLKAAGVPIAGVGLQNHNLMDWPHAADEDATITAFSTLGIKDSHHRA